MTTMAKPIFTGPARHLHDGDRRRLGRRAARALFDLERHPVAMLDDAQLTAAIGKYATNITAALVARGLLERVSWVGDREPARWQLTTEGRVVAALVARRFE